MAKKKDKKKKRKPLIILSSSGHTGHYYTTIKRNKPDQAGRKLSIKKYDPVLRKHVIYVEKKIK